MTSKYSAGEESSDIDTRGALIRDLSLIWPLIVIGVFIGITLLTVLRPLGIVILAAVAVLLLWHFVAVYLHARRSGDHPY